MSFRTNVLPLITQTLSSSSDNVCSRPMWQLLLCLSNTNQVDSMCSFVKRIWWFCSKSRYDCPILPPTLIKLSTTMEFKGNNILWFDKIMSFFKVLNSSGKHSNWTSLNIWNSVYSISLTVVLWGISIVDNFRFRTSHSCLNFKRDVICNTSFIIEE